MTRANPVAAAVAASVLAAMCCGNPSDPTRAGSSPPSLPSLPPSSSLPSAFRNDLARALDAAGDATVLEGQDGWLFFVPELRHLTAGEFWGDAAASVSQATSPEHADPLPAILDFQRQLEAAGVELLLVPVPAKAAIYPETIADSATPSGGTVPRLDEYDAAFYALLRESGVTVIDPTDAFLERRVDAAEPLYCRQDTHWSGAACAVVAELLADVIRRRPWFGEISTTTYEAEPRRVEISGDLWTLLGDESLPRESLALRFVGTPRAEGLEPVPDDPDSPVLLLGDSHGLVFHAGDDMHARGAGLADQLAYELGFALDVMAVRGSGATPARFNLLRRARRSPGFWDQKRLVIWVFSVREFTEADGWRVMPIGAS
jgi:alginate O-acetyltransferase complex protein AlgJ